MRRCGSLCSPKCNAISCCCLRRSRPIWRMNSGRCSARTDNLLKAPWPKFDRRAGEGRRDRNSGAGQRQAAQPVVVAPGTPARSTVLESALADESAGFDRRQANREKDLCSRQAGQHRRAASSSSRNHVHCRKERSYAGYRIEGNPAMNLAASRVSRRLSAAAVALAEIIWRWTSAATRLVSGGDSHFRISKHASGNYGRTAFSAHAASDFDRSSARAHFSGQLHRASLQRMPADIDVDCCLDCAGVIRKERDRARPRSITCHRDVAKQRPYE